MAVSDTQKVSRAVIDVAEDVANDYTSGDAVFKQEGEAIWAVCSLATAVLDASPLLRSAQSFLLAHASDMSLSGFPHTAATSDEAAAAIRSLLSLIATTTEHSTKEEP